VDLSIVVGGPAIVAVGYRAEAFGLQLDDLLVQHLYELGNRDLPQVGYRLAHQRPSLI
jgi:hypothetical protein